MKETGRRKAEDALKEAKKDRRSLIGILEEKSRAVGINLSIFQSSGEVTDAVCRLLGDIRPEFSDKKEILIWKDPLFKRLGLVEKISKMGIGVLPSSFFNEEGRKERNQRLARACAGITTADFCVAKTATLALRTEPTSPKTVSLLPENHIVILPSSRIIHDLHSLFLILSHGSGSGGLGNCLTLITGPSKTADIEAHLVYGAHGPRSLHLFVMDQE